jgi:hypothetical protein
MKSSIGHDGVAFVRVREERPFVQPQSRDPSTIRFFSKP